MGGVEQLGLEAERKTQLSLLIEKDSLTDSKNPHQAADTVPGTGTGTIAGSPKPRPHTETNHKLTKEARHPAPYGE